MAYTSPDNIWSADTDTLMDIPAITGALAASVQAALIERGNTFTGESDDRNNSTGIQDGAIWVDTNGDRTVYVRHGGNWVPLVPEQHFYAGRIWSPSAENVPSDTTHTLSWPGAFNQTKGMSYDSSGLTIPRTGWYQVSGGVRWDADTNGVRQLRVMVGGNNVAAAYVDAALLTAHTASVAVHASQGEKVQLAVRHNAGSTVSTRTDLGMPYLSAAYLGE